MWVGVPSWQKAPLENAPWGGDRIQPPYGGHKLCVQQTKLKERDAGFLRWVGDRRSNYVMVSSALLWRTPREILARGLFCCACLSVSNAMYTLPGCCCGAFVSCAQGFQLGQLAAFSREASLCEPGGGSKVRNKFKKNVFWRCRICCEVYTIGVDYFFVCLPSDN